MQAEIISIGDELLIGQTVNTNSTWLGEKLNSIGIRVHRSTSIADHEQEIILALDEASARSQLILLTGGLGPTRDDITKTTLCRYFDTTLEINEEALARITAMFESRGLPMLEVNRQQAALPKSCQVIQNQLGTACGMWFERSGVVFVSMPGVPYEMKGMMEKEVIARIMSHFRRPGVVHRTILTMGIGESFLAEKIRDWENSLASDDIRLAYLPSPGMLKLRMSVYGKDPEAVRGVMLEREHELHALAGEYIFGYEEETIAEIVGALLTGRGETLACAESCTGGFLSHLVTEVPGSSAYFMGTLVSYAESVKTSELGVDQGLIDTHTAVSSQVAEAMAEGIRSKLGTTWALSTTGIAGPTGGSEEIPIGTVWVGLAGPGVLKSQVFRLGRSRERTIQVASAYALNLLRKEILAQGA